VVVTSVAPLFHFRLHDREPGNMVILNELLGVDRVTGIVNRGAEENCTGPIFYALKLPLKGDVTFNDINLYSIYNISRPIQSISGD